MYDALRRWPGHVCIIFHIKGLKGLLHVLEMLMNVFDLFSKACIQLLPEIRLTDSPEKSALPPGPAQSHLQNASTKSLRLEMSNHLRE
jgi:hypothetical protein